MRLVVETPALPGIEVRLTEIVPAHDGRRAWVLRVLDAGDGDVVIERSRDLRTALGWPVALLDVRRARDARLVAFYSFLEYAAAVSVIAADPAAIAAGRAALEAALLAGRPDWRDDRAICIADLMALP